MALGRIKDKVNLLDRSAVFRIARKDGSGWHIRLESKKDVPEGGLLMVVHDNGTVDLCLSQTNLDVQGWLASAKPAQADRQVKLRPEAAFRLGLATMEKWRRMSPADFFTSRGAITLSRSDENRWFMDVFGYYGTPLGGWWVSIKDNGETSITSGL